MGDVQDLAVQVPREVSQHWGWLLAFGLGIRLITFGATWIAIALSLRMG